MKATRVDGAPGVGIAARSRVAERYSVAHRVAINTPLSRFRQPCAETAEVEIEDVEKALASLHKEPVATQRQVQALRRANTHIIEPAPQHEDARSAPQYSTSRHPNLCLSEGVDPDTISHIEQLLVKRIRFRKGAVLYRVGGGFNALYAIRKGMCKTVLIAQDGQDHLAGFYMAGDIIGIDGIGTERHKCEATALEDVEVCPLPFDQIENLARLSAQFGHNLHTLLSQESTRAHALLIVLATMRAEKRLAVFLLDLSQRYQVRGYSPCEFVMRMSREEIGSYLGLKLETVSRLFSKFQREGLIHVQRRALKLLDRAALSQLVDSGT
jgi:CRP/FNR family transcriptional regulator